MVKLCLRDTRITSLGLGVLCPGRRWVFGKSKSENNKNMMVPFFVRKSKILLRIVFPERGFFSGFFSFLFWVAGW